MAQAALLCTILKRHRSILHYTGTNLLAVSYLFRKGSKQQAALPLSV